MNRRTSRAFMLSALALLSLGWTAASCDNVLDLGHLDKPVPVGQGALFCVVATSQVVDFGLVGADKIVVEDVELTNACGTAVSIDAVTILSDWDFVLLSGGEAADLGADEDAGGAPGIHPLGPAPWATTTLAAGTSTTIRVAFQGTHHRAYAEGALSVSVTSSSASGVVDVALVANADSECLDVTVESGLDFGCQLLGHKRTTTLTVTACGGRGTTLTALSAVGAAGFTVNTDALPVFLAPGERHNLQLSYESSVESVVSPSIAWDTAELTAYGDQGVVAWTGTARAFSRGSSCTGLEIALEWTTPGDPDSSDVGPEAGADLDLHFMHEQFSLDWYRYPFDAFWFNRSPNWGDFSNSSDDPAVSLDSIDGHSGEGMSMLLPQDGRAYRIGVHSWNDHDYGPSDATIVVRVFGKEVFRRTRRLYERDLWDVGLMNWPSVVVLESEGAQAVTPDFKAPCDPAGCKGK